jgi:hypothetical protein
LQKKMLGRVKAMRTVSLFAIWVTMIVADYPEFCHRSCTVSVGAVGAGETRVYMHIPHSNALMKETLTVSSTGSANVSLRAFMPLPYNATDFRITSASLDIDAYVSNTPDLNVYFQTAEYPLLTSGGGRDMGQLGPGTVVVIVEALSTSTFPNGLNILFKINNPGQVSVLELIGMPIPQWKTHAYWWTQQMYFYIFVAVNAALAVLYGVFTRCRMWQWVLVFSIAAFATVANENLYHAILASRRGGSEQDQALMIACVALLANIIPGVIAMLFMRYGKCRAVAWSVVAILFGAGFLFLAGSGWFVGCGLLILAGVIRLAQRAYCCNLVLRQ